MNRRLRDTKVMANSGQGGNDASKVFTSDVSYDLFREIIFSVVLWGSQGEPYYRLTVFQRNVANQ